MRHAWIQLRAAACSDTAMPGYVRAACPDTVACGSMLGYCCARHARILLRAACSDTVAGGMCPVTCARHARILSRIACSDTAVCSMLGYSHVACLDTVARSSMLGCSCARHARIQLRAAACPGTAVCGSMLGYCCAPTPTDALRIVVARATGSIKSPITCAARANAKCLAGNERGKGERAHTSVAGGWGRRAVRTEGTCPYAGRQGLRSAEKERTGGTGGEWGTC